ncbi:MAG TPA: hypothetical protein VMN60_10795 [Longimicrobiales bacterium]|nr:hypothetical protein [Longimicrobiales bacterium]
MSRTASLPLFRPRALHALSAILLVVPAAAAAQHRAPASVPADSLFHGLAARPIGPPGTSGRVAAVAVSPRDDREIWVGAATGGLWKSVDAGFTWTPVMDSVPVNSIGAIGIAPSAPDVIYVGTGEANTRNSMGAGRGVWKTQDGGRGWSYLGLAGTERIEAVIVHPRDPNTVWLSAQGPAWSDGEERGVFKSTDGGRTWRKVLYVDERTGAFELVIDPSNPEHLLASTWEHRRWPWFFTSGGPGSGLWSSWDGGETWRRQSEENGLPKGELGRIGLAFATNEPRVAYALVEADKSALLRSEDGGETWLAVNTETNVNDRPFYYSRIYVDPTNENRVYRVAGDLTMSEDGGRTFRSIAPWSSVHVDHHGFWTHPDGRTIISGNDGGVYISHDRGGAWRFVENLVLAQFYHLSVDNATPFNVYGGLQDNGSWQGPSEVWETPSFKGSHIVAHHWKEIGFGDGFAALIDPRDPNLGYSMSQGGNLRRFNLVTGEERDIVPTPPDDTTRLRFNWNAGIALDPNDADVLYYGSQFLHMSRDRGETWQIISPDLTTNDPEKQKQAESGGLTLDVTAAENHTTILTIAPSPVERGVIWIGTDDGNVQLTRDGGRSWSNVVTRIRGVPEATWVPHVEASKHAAGTAYVVFDNHRRGDWTPYVYRTTDYGASWQPLSPAQIDGYALAIEEDPVEPNLLFLGTEFGMYFSLDAGRTWRKWTNGGYPASASTMALVVHPRDHDLAIGTHGRGAWIIDDVRPLRALARNARIAEMDVHLFEIPPAIQHTRGMSGPFYFPGDTKYHGPNRPYGALISYWVGADAAQAVAADTGSAPPEAGGFMPAAQSGGRGPARIEVLDGDSVIRALRGPAKHGVNRIAWALERRGIPQPGAAPDAAEPAGPEVLPGRYRVRVHIGEDVAEGTVDVLQDPRTDRPIIAMRQNLETIRRGQRAVADLRRAVDQLERTQSALELYGKELKRWEAVDSATRASLVERTDSVKAHATALLDRLRLPRDTKGIVDDTTVTSQLQQALGRATSTPDQPALPRVEVLERAIARAGDLLAEIDQFYQTEVSSYRDALRAAGFELLGGS